MTAAATVAEVTYAEEASSSALAASSEAKTRSLLISSLLATERRHFRWRTKAINGPTKSPSRTRYDENPRSPPQGIYLGPNDNMHPAAQLDSPSFIKSTGGGFPATIVEAAAHAGGGGSQARIGGIVGTQ